MNISKVIFNLSLMLIAFGYGVAVGTYQIFPYHGIKYAINSTETIFGKDSELFSDLPMGFLAEHRYQGRQVTRNDSRQTSPGLTLLAGFFEDLPEVRLIQLDGTIVHRWPLAYKSLFPNSDHIKPHSDAPASNWNAAIHGTLILPDGSLIFNFDGKGTVKLDRCNNTVWTLARMTHHSIDLTSDGTLWIPSRYYIDEQPAYPFFSVPYHDDTLLHVSSDGEVIEEISLNKLLINNGLYALLVGNGQFSVDVVAEDPLHLNDIEQLPEALANQFLLFEAGDLLLSLRHLDLILVIDPSAKKVKWYHFGPWLRQHDPDFQPDGTISVLNNNSDDTKDGSIFNGSQILKINPSAADRPVTVIYGAQPNQKFFTNTQGKHQVLNNGNILIAEYYGGRAFEINSKGDIVWEYINYYDDEHVAKISGATRLTPNYFTVEDWSCDN